MLIRQPIWDIWSTLKHTPAFPTKGVKHTYIPHLQCVQFHPALLFSFFLYPKNLKLAANYRLTSMGFLT